MHITRTHLLGLLAAAALAGCGGGAGSNDEAATKAAAADEGWQTLSTQGGSFSLASAQVVRFGADTRWTQRTMAAGTQWCTASFFGSDPAPGASKVCQRQAEPATGEGTWQRVTGQGGSFTLDKGYTVRFGVGNAWTQRTMAAGTQWCTASFFGSDPAPGQAKSCEKFVPGTATATAALVATRTIGPAPLAVLFDATDTTSTVAGTDVFRQVTYSFDFGDDRGETWAVSGQPKNTQSGGPLAAHVFDRPGTYTVKVRASGSPGGAFTERTATITVQDPDAVYANDKTVCVSTSANYTGCPTGAVHLTTLPSDFDYSSQRVLLRRGESFGRVRVRHGAENVQVGTFGSGSAKPRVEAVEIGDGSVHANSNPTHFPKDVTVMDLDVSSGITQTSSMTQLLLYRNDLTRDEGTLNDNHITVGGAIEWWTDPTHNPGMTPGQFINPSEIFVVENRVVGHALPGPPDPNHWAVKVLFQASAARMALMGNDMEQSIEHTARIYRAHKTFIAHNALRGIFAPEFPDGSSIRLALKLHSGGLLPYADNWGNAQGKWASSQIVMADNLLGNPRNNGYFTAGIAPQNKEPETVEGIEDVVIERNRFIRGPFTNTEMENVGRRITTRGNTRVDGGTPQLSFGQASPNLPPEWYGPIYHD